jgi:hypothetical protein
MLTEDLLNSIKRRSLVPISQQTFQDSDLIAFANEEMSINLVPEIQRVREDMFLRKKSVTMTASKYRYLTPERAIGNAVKSIMLMSGENGLELPRVDVSKIAGSNQSGSPLSFFLEDNYISLYPTPSSSETLDIWYYARPNTLVETTACGKVTAISNVAGTVSLTVDTNLSGDLSTGESVDILSGRSPFILWGMDCVITSISSTVIEVSTASVSDEAGNVNIAVGDYVCEAKTANIPMIPEEFHPVLCQMVTCRLLEGLGDLNKLTAALAKLAEMKSSAIALIANRTENAVEYINNRNSILNSGRFLTNRISAPR